MEILDILQKVPVQYGILILAGWMIKELKNLITRFDDYQKLIDTEIKNLKEQCKIRHKEL